MDFQWKMWTAHKLSYIPSINLFRILSIKSSAVSLHKFISSGLRTQAPFFLWSEALLWFPPSFYCINARSLFRRYVEISSHSTLAKFLQQHCCICVASIHFAYISEPRLVATSIGCNSVCSIRRLFATFCRLFFVYFSPSPSLFPLDHSAKRVFL